jgi:hypothetical protein
MEEVAPFGGSLKCPDFVVMDGIVVRASSASQNKAGPHKKL